MKFSAIIAIVVAVVALTSLVAVEASPVLDRRGRKFMYINYSKNPINGSMDYVYWKPIVPGYWGPINGLCYTPSMEKECAPEK
ncbi:hypothetical protein BDF22DRAFT_685769, partial [Syncephalis plumigaleata]